jgi:hypothetical protein
MFVCFWDFFAGDDDMMNDFVCFAKWQIDASFPIRKNETIYALVR